MRPARLKVDSLPACPDGIATVVAVPKTGGEVLIGEAASRADDALFLKLANWKMLLGKSTAELQTEIATNTDLANLLEITTLDQVALSYFKAMLQQTLGREPEVVEKPQVILGIPPSSSNNQVNWRRNYKRRIERVFEELDYPRPRFWPEPFAVFQYHLNLVEIRDVGTRQNVLIVDIGGGTTDICVIQTTQHGRLARGGLNHVPHGVRSIEVGGATLDACIARELGLDASVNQVEQLIKAAKEELSENQQGWGGVHLDRTVQFDWSGRQFDVSARLIKRVFESKVWPAIDATLDESIDDVTQRDIVTDRIHIVILAGGTCQLGLTQGLVEQKLRGLPLFEGVRFVVSSNYRSAVAHGLAIEAAANSRHHEMLPSRVSAYLQEDLKFECGHRPGTLYVPHKAKSDYRSEGDLANGILLKAPKEIGRMLNRPRNWRFLLKQNTREFFYRFSKVSNTDETDVLVDDWCRIARSKETRPGRQLGLTMTLQEDGFAQLSLETAEDATFELRPIDLHDLSGLEGDTFFAVDFGTDNTQVAYVNVKDPDLLQPLPSSYVWDPRADRRARELVSRASKALGYAERRRDTVRELNEQAIVEYVYHSNRIEGSLLDRGDTQRVLEQSHGMGTEARADVLGAISRLGTIDENGSIVPAPMIVRDTLAAVNLRNAFQFVEELSGDRQRPFSMVTLRQIHELVMKGMEEAWPGQFRHENVAISKTTFVPPDFLQVDQLCQEMLVRFESKEFAALSPILQAVEAHARFVSIHPFADGNGRVARLLVNYFMWRADLPGLLLPWENRDRYYDALEECNSKEPGLWGNLTDLTNLFCDVLEESIDQIEQARGDSDDVAQEAAVVETTGNDDSEFGRLIADLKVGGTAVRLNFEEQYEDWLHTMSGVISDLKELTGQLSRVFRAEFGGTVYVRDFPLIDIETYRSIRARERTTRTWCLGITLDFLSETEELIFYFGANSKLAEELKKGLRKTCSMHIGRFVAEASRHVPVSRQDWSRLLEVTHDGSDLGVLLRDPPASKPAYVTDERARVENWFGILVRDLLDSRA